MRLLQENYINHIITRESKLVINLIVKKFEIFRIILKYKLETSVESPNASLTDCQLHVGGSLGLQNGYQ